MAKLKPSICFILTTDFSVKAFLLAHIKALSAHFDITVVTNTNNPNFLIELGIPVKVIPLNIARNIHLLADAKSLLALINLFYNMRFDAVHSVTPKAGLLAMLAAWMVRVPLRVHMFTGQVWASKSGIKRLILKWVDCLIAALTTHNLVDSPSQLQFLIDERVTKQAKSTVFAKGSISGVDLARFKTDVEQKLAIRKQLKIADNQLVFLFIGRLNIDKGVLDLAHAFAQLNDENLHLLFVGPDEQNMRAEIINLQNNKKNVHFVGHTDKPEAFMAAADVLCLPSYREGFGAVLIEAAACGVPAIASRIYGITDAVVDNQTGLLHPPRDVNAIKGLMACIASNEALRHALGEQARQRVSKDFSSELITQTWVDFYQYKLGTS
ncbi:MAG: glycosyltransferase family 4 protein [Methylophilaceae bacterium]|nr:MAG: glycosyltransferase family 4 protein [Methylophilaceae bacterium]